MVKYILSRQRMYGSIMNANKKLTSLSQFVDQEYRLKWTSNRDQFETEYENFKEEILIQQAIQEKEGRLVCRLIIPIL